MSTRIGTPRTGAFSGSTNEKLAGAALPEERMADENFEYAPVAYFIISRSGVIIKKNQKAAQLFKIQDEEPAALSLLDLVPPDYQPNFIALLDVASSTGSSVSDEMFFVLNNGFPIQAKIFINKSFAAMPGEERFRLIVTDIADLKQLYDRQLLESESRYRELAENINEGIYLTERSFITMVNKPLLRIFGYEMQEVLGRKVWEFVVPERRKIVRNFFIRKVEELDTSPVETECLRKDGSRFWAEIRISIFKEQHKVFGVFSDITNRKNAELALKESEQKYRSVVTAMNDGIILRDINGHVIAWNSAAERILDLNPEEIRSLLSIHPGWKAIREDGSPFTAESHPAIITLRTGSSKQNIVMGIHNSKEQLKWITINSEPIFGKDDKTPTAVVTSFSDITELKKTENKLRELNSIKDKLFGIIAHDLKSPYNAQMGFLELLMEENLSYTLEQRKHFVKMLYESARQSFALLDNLLVWSRTQTGRIPFNPLEFGIDELIENAVRFFKLAASVKQIELRIFKNGNPSMVKADYEMANTALRNLISNAIKFTPTGGEVAITAYFTANEHIKIAVKDTGTGMSKELLDSLFTSDEISSTPGTENEKGTGLGLIICKEFVERNGGNIWAESIEGKGSTFFFTLKNASIQQKCSGACMLNLQEVYLEISQNAELRRDFETTIAGRFRDSFKSFSPVKLHQFSEKLTEIVEKYDIEALKSFSGNFSYECIMRDQNQVNICFSEFEKLIDKIEFEQQIKTNFNR